MSKRKGVSAEEKRTRMLQLFYERKEFYQLKDLEKIAPQEKGIVAQSVKDVVQALVDDGLVDTAKIGTSVYFWAYPGKNIKATEKKIEVANKEIFEAEMKIEILNNQISSLKDKNKDTNELRELAEKIKPLRQKEAELEKEVEKNRDNDPAVLERSKKDVEKCREAAQTWADNIYAVRSWCKKKFDISEVDFNKQFGIPDEFDSLL